VDDNFDNLSLVGEQLHAAGLNYDTANNGREALAKIHGAAGSTFDLVLMDLQMPEMDGFKATQELRSEGYKKPIIALTAHATPEVRSRCSKVGFNTHLSKPIDRASLLRTLHAFAV
jgi:CheY-like chemotaxis protein